MNGRLRLWYFKARYFMFAKQVAFRKYLFEKVVAR